MSQTLQYRRGDGALVKLQIERTAELDRPAVTVPQTPEAKKVVTATTPQLRQNTLQTGSHLRDDQIAPCVLFVYMSEHSPLEQQQNCLLHIRSTTNPRHAQIRLVLNNPSEALLQQTQDWLRDRYIQVAYCFTGPCDKYAAMGIVFRDSEQPITAEWVMWFDDCIMADVNPNWFPSLQWVLNEYRTKYNAHLFGVRYTQTVPSAFRDWLLQQPWHRRKVMRRRDGKPAADGNFIFFPIGSFFVISRQALEQSQVPSPLANEHYGDVLIGEQVYQNNFGLKHINGESQLLRNLKKSREVGAWPAPGTRNYTAGVCHDWRRLQATDQTTTATTSKRERVVDGYLQLSPLTPAITK